MAFFELKYITKVLLCLSMVGSLTSAIDRRNFTQIAKDAGLPCEEYEITTEDGYILYMFRVPGDSSRPVLLLSGCYGTADDYMIRENLSLPYVLSNAGYDTWVGSVRGSRYGRRHVSLNPDKDDEFWDFSFHEYAVYDTKAMIDFVLNHTQQEQLSSIGWSLGTTSFYILGSEKPEYVNKVKLQVSFAPIAYLHSSPAFASMVVPGTLISPVAEVIGKEEIFGEYSPETILIRNTCSTPTTAYKLCLTTFFVTYGFNYEQIEPDFAATIFAHYPSGVSRKTLTHLLQVIRKKRFANYDYGPIENRRRYGSLLPRKYNLSRNNMSILMLSGKNDQTSVLSDVELLKPQLPNVIEHIILESEKFNHVDFVYGRDTAEILYKTTVLDYLNKYN